MREALRGLTLRGRAFVAAGVTAIVQPGGSVRDELTIEAAKAAGVTMYVTGTRHFAH